jgi:hypothetical protein
MLWMTTVGWLEIGFALMLVIFWKARWPLWFTVCAMCAATLAVGVNSSKYLTAAFNPVTLNLATAMLAVIGLLVSENLPTAANCHRSPPEPTL